MTWGIVRECDSETVRQWVIWLSAVGFPLSAGLYSKKKEGQRPSGPRVVVSP